MNIQTIRFALISSVLLLCLSPEMARCQLPEPTAQDPFKQSVPSFDLVNQTVADGFAQLNQTTNVTFAIEFPLGRTISAPAPALTTLMATVGSGTLADALDRLCDLDRTFSWHRIGNTVHVLPRALEDDQTYLLNRKIAALNFRDVPDADGALYQAVAQLPGAKEQIAVMQTGIPLSFSRPWTASFKDITVRELIDKIAQQLGRNYGWQFGGANDFRVVTFHQRLSVKPRQGPVEHP